MWESKFIIDTDVQVELGSYKFEEAEINIEPLPNVDCIELQSDKVRYCKVLVSEEIDDNIEAVYLHAKSLLTRFLERVALLTYGHAKIVYELPTCKASVPDNTTFLVLWSFHDHFRNFNSPLKPDDMRSFNSLYYEKEYLDVCIGLFASAMNTDSRSEKVLLYSSILERLALEESEEYVTKKCEKCGEETRIDMKATKGYSKALLKSKGASKSEIDLFLNDNRNKIAHGGGLRDLSFFNDLNSSIKSVQHIIAELLIERIGIRMVNSQTSFIDHPWAIYQFIRSHNGFELTTKESIKFSNSAFISRVAIGDDEARRNLHVRIGLSMGPQNLVLNNKSFQEAFFPGR